MPKLVSHAYPIVTVVREEEFSHCQSLQIALQGLKRAHSSSKKMLSRGKVRASITKDHRCHSGHGKQRPSSPRSVPATPGLTGCDPRPAQSGKSTQTLQLWRDVDRKSRLPGRAERNHDSELNLRLPFTTSPSYEV